MYGTWPACVHAGMWLNMSAGVSVSQLLLPPAGALSGAVCYAEPPKTQLWRAAVLSPMPPPVPLAGTTTTTTGTSCPAVTPPAPSHRHPSDDHRHQHHTGTRPAPAPLAPHLRPPGDDHGPACGLEVAIHRRRERGRGLVGVAGGQEGRQGQPRGQVAGRRVDVGVDGHTDVVLWLVDVRLGGGAAGLLLWEAVGAWLGRPGLCGLGV